MDGILMIYIYISLTYIWYILIIGISSLRCIYESSRSFFKSKDNIYVTRYSQAPTPKRGFVTGSRIWSVPGYRISSSTQVWLRKGHMEQGHWELFCVSVITGQLHTTTNLSVNSYLYINNSRLVFHPDWSQKVCITLTHDVTGRHLPLVTAPEWELGDGSLHASGPHLPGLTMAAKKGWEYGIAMRCSQLWEESEMVLQRKILTGI